MTIDKTKTADTSKTGVEIVDYTNGQKPASVKSLTNILAGSSNVTVSVIEANTDNTLIAKHKEDIGINLYPVPATPTATPLQ